MWATKGRTHPLGQLVGAEQAPRLHHPALAVHPLGLYRIEPRTLRRQKAADDPYPLLLTLPDLAVVPTYPLLYLLTPVPRGVVPHQDQHLLARREEFLRAPLKEARRYAAHGAAVHEAQPGLLELRQIKPVAGDGLRVGLVLGDQALLRAQRLALLA